ncbi:hypothetical protein N7507_007003 [Penicillium longicatenatum]|nr:hypothetical protein N7507_007003 [Penicillium longicatenatum]
MRPLLRLARLPRPVQGFVTSARLQVNANTPKPDVFTIDSIGESVKAVPLKWPDVSHNHAIDKSIGPSFATIEAVKPAKVVCSDHGLSIEAPGVLSLPLDYSYLRDLCKCPQCVDRYSKQRSFRTNDIPTDIRPRHIKWDGEHLEIQWANDTPGAGPDHLSRWHHSYLRKPTLNTHDIHEFSNKTKTWDAKIMQKHQHWVSYEDYMTNDANFAASMRNLQRTGLIFVKDIPDSREEVAKVATRMGPLRNTFYGMTWDVRTVPEAKNVAYTNHFLGFHMDLMYMNEPPGYQLLHCLENSCDGGESLFADAFRAAYKMKQSFPEEFKELTRRKLGYEYVHEDQIYYNERPVFELAESSQHLRHVNYSPPFQSAMPIEGELRFQPLKKALDVFTQMLESEEMCFDLKLNPGECVIFDNRRIVHARRHFNTSTGSRWLAGAYVDTDAVLSRFNVMSKKQPDVWQAADCMIQSADDLIQPEELNQAAAQA